MAEAGESRPLPDEVVAALHRGDKIAAIKLLRETRGIGLKEAKDQVDRFAAADPVLRQKFCATTVSGARGCLFWLILLLFVGYGAWQLFTGR